CDPRRSRSGRAVGLRARLRPPCGDQNRAVQLVRLRRSEREPRLRPMTMPRRVVITGIGSVNAAGHGGSSAVAAALARPPEAISAPKTFPGGGRQSGAAAEGGRARLIGLLGSGRG